MLRCSVGVTAYNEQANIGRLLQALLDQDLHEVAISEIIVVASGCTDNTIPMVQEFCAKDPRVQLFIQEKREGKTSAVNLFLQHAKEDICVVESGDTLPRDDTIENLIRPFNDPKVGMTGAHKVPVNAPDDFVGYASHLRLQLEHELCLEIPRLGELIAFRNVVPRIPPDVAMDEAFVEAFVVERNLQVRYAPDAIVYNMGPTTLRDFIKQRRRNYAGHLHLKHKYKYKVSSLNTTAVTRLAANELFRLVKLIAWMFWAASVEFFARGLGAWDYYVRGKKHEVWDMAWTTKEVNVKEERAE